MIDVMSTMLMDIARRWDYATDPGALAAAPFAELGNLGWRYIVFPPAVTSGLVGVTLSSVEMGLFFGAVMVPLGLFFYWVISNLRRLRRTSHEINNLLQVLVGRDPAAMKRLQDAHRERITGARRPR